MAFRFIVCLDVVERDASCTITFSQFWCGKASEGSGFFAKDPTRGNAYLNRDDADAELFMLAARRPDIIGKLRVVEFPMRRLCCYRKQPGVTGHGVPGIPLEDVK